MSRPAASPSVAPRVLLVEDDPGDVFLTRELLAEVDSPIELTVADSVADAISSGALRAADCVLLDLQLPDFTGNDRLDALRMLRDQAPASCAICVLTGLDDEHLGAAAMAEGAQDYLVKGSVNGSLLTRSVRYAIERRRAERNAVRLREAQLARAESARVERGLLPRLLLNGGQVWAEPFYQPGRRSPLGGDFYDAVRCEDGSVHAIIGDVAGHGPDEAALGALLRVSWRALVLSGVGEPHVLPALEQVLISERPARTMFTTLCTVALRRADEQMTAQLRVAGHPPPMLVRPEVGELPCVVGPPLGVISDARWPIVTTPLPHGWAVMLYTDGLIEGRAAPDQGDRLWNSGLLGLLEQYRGNRLADLPERLAERVVELNGGPLGDDVAILLLRERGTEDATGNGSGSLDAVGRAPASGGPERNGERGGAR